jgi:hypothetical protein
MRDVVDLYLRDRIRRLWRRALAVSVEEAARRLAERLGKEELRRTLAQAVEAGMPAAEALRHAAANGLEGLS